MKKIFLTIAIVAFASTAFAANVSIIDTTSIGGSPFNPSKLVTLEATASAIAYTVTSCHLNGTKEYASVGGNTTADTSTIFQKDIPEQGTNTTCNPTDPGTTAGDMPSGTWE